MSARIHPELLSLAAVTLDNGKGATKTAFTPAGGGDPAAAAAPPMDPAMAGGMPPGMPPMDPAMAGGMPPGAPPMDPAAMGGMPPGGAGPMPPEIQMAIDQAVQTAMAGQGGAAPGAAPGAAAGGAKKLDPAMLYLALERIRKLIDNMYKINGWELPPDILDDNMMAQAIAGMPVQSPPIGQDAGAAAPPPPGAGGTIPGIGTSPPIAPPEMPKAAAEIVMGMPVPQDATPAQQMDSATMHMDRMAYLSRSLKNGS